MAPLNIKVNLVWVLTQLKKKSINLIKMIKVQSEIFAIALYLRGRNCNYIYIYIYISIYLYIYYGH